MRGVAAAFGERLVKLLRRGPVLGSAPPRERGTGLAMPKVHKLPETQSEVKDAPPADTTEPAPAARAAGKAAGPAKKAAATGAAGRKTAAVKAAPSGAKTPAATTAK